MAGNTCDVCGREPILGVASSSFAAVSWAFCKECIEKPAEPLTTFSYLYDFVSTDGDGLAPEVNNFYTWKDGKYISWAEYVEERRKQPLCEKHKTTRLDWEGNCAECGYEEACANAPPLDTTGFDEIVEETR